MGWFLPLLAGAGRLAATEVATTAAINGAKAAAPRMAQWVAGRAGTRALADGAEAAVGRFAGDKLAVMGRQRALDFAEQAARRTNALNRLPQPSTLELIKDSLLPKSVAEAAMRFGPEVLSMGVMTAATGSPMVGLETSLYSLGGGLLGGSLGGGIGALTRGARRGNALRSHVGGAVTIGDFAGSLTGNFMPSQAMKGLEEESLRQQELQLAQRDDQVRRQTLQGLQQVSPYAASPYSTSPYAASLYG